MSPEDFRALVAAGLNTDQIAIVMGMMARDKIAVSEADEARKQKARDRVSKWRERHRNVSETSPKVTVRLTRAEEVNLLPSVVSKEEKKVSKPRATRLPTEFEPDLAFAAEQGLSSSQAQSEVAKFRDYWGSKGSGATKTDWQATWRNWARTASERKPRDGPGKVKPPSAGEMFGQFEAYANGQDRSDIGAPKEALHLLPPLSGK